MKRLIQVEIETSEGGTRCGPRCRWFDSNQTGSLSLAWCTAFIDEEASRLALERGDPEEHRLLRIEGSNRSKWPAIRCPECIAAEHAAKRGEDEP